MLSLNLGNGSPVFIIKDLRDWDVFRSGRDARIAFEGRGRHKGRIGFVSVAYRVFPCEADGFLGATIVLARESDLR